MLKSLTHLTTLGAALLAPGAAGADVKQDTTDVATLIAAYHQAVTSHDGARLAQLFAPAGTAWFTVLAERPWAAAQAKNPGSQKVRPGSVDGFVRLVTTSKAALDPEHSNLKITSDGEIATATFDFRFLIDGREENRGAESWQLVRGADGWRIVSIVFSSTPTR